MSNSQIKIIAILSMLIDHIGSVLITNPNIYLVFRSIGRLAFPIFAFYIAEGCLKTKNIKHYLLRLLIFGFVSEIPFDYAIAGKMIEMNHQNVFFTLFLGALSIFLYKYITDKKKKTETLAFAVVIMISLLASFLQTDYGALGVLVIFIIYYNKDNFKKQAIAIIVMNLLFLNPIQLWACFSIIPLYFYNKTRGINLKYLFYFFYPVHLLILGLLSSYYFI